MRPSRLPSIVYPELATLVNQPPEGSQWLHEVKFDGYRLLAFKKDNQVRLFTRRGNDWTHKFHNVAKAVSDLPIPDIILDGEVVVLDEKQHSNFQLLQNSLKAGSNQSFIYYVFDLLYYDQYNLMSQPLLERKNILHQLIDDEDEILRYSDHIFGSGKKILEKSCELGLEGIVSKDANSIYQQKRTKCWLKSKCIKRQEFVIGGYTPPQGSRKYFGALLLGTYNQKGQLLYNGNCGTGFTQASLKSIHTLLKNIKSAEMPFHTKPPGSNRAIWVKPRLVAEVEFTEWTEENILRHPSFKGLRSDKAPKDIIKENPLSITRVTKSMKTKSSKSVPPIKITNPDRLYYPEIGLSKLDILQYYQEIQNWILPYILNRVLTLVRCPENYHDCFFQKHVNKSSPAEIHGIKVKEHGKTENCIFIKDVKGLLTLPQMGALEIHPWGSTIKNLEHPDIIIFDLDPAPDVHWKDVVSAAKEVKSLLKQLKLTSYVKTTGGKGLHVTVPIKPDYTWNQIKSFTHTFVDYLVMQKSHLYIGKMTKAKRKGKIFIDYLRNQRGATAIAPYSTRARENAPVATPVDWDELTTDIRDTFFTVKTLPERLSKLKKDPWKDFFKKPQKLKLDDLG